MATKKTTKRGQRRDRRSTGRRSGPTRSAGSARDAISLLKADHRSVKALLKSLGSAEGARRTSGFEKVKQELERHTKIEETLVYPALRDAGKTKKDQQMFHEATEEHHTVDVVLPEVERSLSEDDVFAARLKVLSELVHHHIEEEESEMFPRLRTLLGGSELRRIGGQIQAAKRSDTRRSGGPLSRVASMVGI